MLDPYSHAPRLPEDGPVDLRGVFLDAEGQPIAAEAAPVELEVGPGRGWFTVERAEADPGTHIIGLEIKKKWATIVDDRLKKRALAGRARVFFGDARQIVPRLVPGSLRIAYFHFPDPWWKKRHEKRLVVNVPMLKALHTALCPGGELFIQTDVDFRADEYEAIVAESGCFAAFGSAPRIEDHSFVARSPRERIAMRDGIPVFRLHYRARTGL